MSQITAFRDLVCIDCGQPLSDNGNTDLAEAHAGPQAVELSCPQCDVALIAARPLNMEPPPYEVLTS